MRYICLLIGIFFFAAGVEAQQCPPMPAGTVCLTQAAADDIAHKLDELKALRETVAAFLNERKANEAERLAYQNVLKATDAAIAAYQQGITDRDKIIALWEKAFNSAMALADHYQAQLSKGKSGWAKFAQALKEVMLLASGIAIGRL